MSTRNSLIRRRDLLTGAAALAAFGGLARGQSVTPQIGGGIGQGFDGALGGAGNGPVPYLGNVATRTMVPNNGTNSVFGLSSRRVHFLRDSVTSIQLVIPNFCVGQASSWAEVTSTGVVQVRGSILYNGTFFQAKFGGNVTYSGSGSPFIVSDPIAISAPAGATVSSNCWLFNTVGGGMAYNVWASGNPGEYPGDGFDFSLSSGVPPADQTMSPTFTSNGLWNGQNMLGPIALLSQTTRPSIYLIGDSRCSGAGDVYDSSGDLGELARSIGPSFAYINAGSEGDALSFWLSSHAARSQFAAWCSHAVLQAGVNDITGGTTPATVASNRALVRSAINLPMWETTLPTETSSTDNWTTTGNQTAIANPANRTTFNTGVRAGSTGMKGYFDIASVTDASGVWNANGTTAKLWTPDGIHESQFANIQIKNSGVVNTSGFTH